MGFKVNFTDNQNVDALSLNEIAESIAGTSAEESFSDGVLYGVSDLNGITRALITRGVSQGCSVSCDGSETIVIGAGVAFFADGRKITIDSDGLTLKRDTSSECNVWLSNDEASGMVSAKCTKEAPSGDYVMLATVSKSGAVTKKQDKALMKNASLLPNHYSEAINVTIPAGSPAGQEITKVIDAGGDFRRIVAIGTETIAYLDFESMKGYVAGGIEAHNMLTEPLTIPLSYSGDSRMTFVSFEDGSLTLKLLCGYASSRCIICFM